MHWTASPGLRVHCFREAVVAYLGTVISRNHNEAECFSNLNTATSAAQYPVGMNGMHVITCIPGMQQCSMQITLAAPAG